LWATGAETAAKDCYSCVPSVRGPDVFKRTRLLLTGTIVLVDVARRTRHGTTLVCDARDFPRVVILDVERIWNGKKQTALLPATAGARRYHGITVSRYLATRGGAFVLPRSRERISRAAKYCLFFYFFSYAACIFPMDPNDVSEN